MKRETHKSLDERRRIVAYLDGLQAKVNAPRELQSQTQEKLDTLSSVPSVESGILFVLQPAEGTL